MGGEGGFRYVLEEEQIVKYLKVPIVQRLEWLEEANRFILSAIPPRNLEIWQKFRRGEI